MKINDNQSTNLEYKVYLRSANEWVSVTEELYRTYYRDIWATRKRAQAHGQCMCPKSKTWMCDGDCLVCEFRSAGDNLSLDYTVEDGESNQKSWADFFSEQRTKIFEKYGSAGEDGKYHFEADNEEKAISELDELLDMEVAPDVSVLDIPVSENLRLSVNDLTLLAPFIHFVET